jgi:hypothetical protein
LFICEEDLSQGAKKDRNCHRELAEDSHSHI